MSPPLLAARGLSKRFGAVVAADDVTVEIAAGETVGIIGANGAGKTTFVNMVTGYLKPDRGRISFKGADITHLKPRAVTRLGVRRSFQVAQLFANLSVRDNVLVALAGAEARRPSAMAPLRTGKRIAEAEALLARFGLADAGDRFHPAGHHLKSGSDESPNPPRLILRSDSLPWHPPTEFGMAQDGVDGSIQFGRLAGRRGRRRKFFTIWLRYARRRRGQDVGDDER